MRVRKAETWQCSRGGVTATVGTWSGVGADNGRRRESQTAMQVVTR
jgi:hypothetical protein